MAAHRVFDLHVDLAVREAPQSRVGERHTEHVGDAGGKVGVGRTGDQLELAPGRGRLADVLHGSLQPPDHLLSVFLRTTLAGTPTAVAPSGTSFVTTDPAPVREPLPSLTGATSIVSTPTNAPSPISVRFFWVP